MRTRLDKILGREGQEEVRFPEDITEIRNMVSDLHTLSNRELEGLWSDFSGSRCAQWLYVSNETLCEFKQWLNEEEYE